MTIFLKQCSVSSRTIYNTKANTKFPNQWQTLPVLDICIISYIYLYLINHWKRDSSQYEHLCVFQGSFSLRKLSHIGCNYKGSPQWESSCVYGDSLSLQKLCYNGCIYKVSPQYESWDCVNLNSFPVKVLSQWLCTYGFSPVWALICIPSFLKQCSVSSRTT